MAIIYKDLTHFGVKGMHWGTVHNLHNAAKKLDTAKLDKDAKSISNIRAGKSKTKTAFKEKVANAGGLHKVSDEELKSMLSRLDMEQKYTKIVSEDATKRAEGRKTALKVLGEFGKVALPILFGLAAKKASDRGVFRTTAHVTKPTIDAVKKALTS